MPLSGIIFLAWDAVSTEGYNSLQQVCTAARVLYGNRGKACPLPTGVHVLLGSPAAGMLGMCGTGLT